MAHINELINKAQKGDDEAFLILFQSYERDIYRMAFLYMKNKHDALDVVQETAYRSFKKIETVKNPEFIKTWLIKIAVSCSIDMLRKQKKVVQLTPEHTNQLKTNDNDLPLSISLQDLLESLKENEKHIIFLKFYNGNTLNEIADIVELPLSTVKSVFYRALEKLRKKVRRVDLYE